MLENTSSINSVYTLRPLSEMPKDFKVASGNRVSRIIIKGDESKKSQFCQLPEVSENLVQVFINNENGMILVKELIESLQDKIVRNCFVNLGRSACDSDLSVESLIQIGLAESDNVRLTKETITANFSAWSKRIALSIALERDATAAAALLSENEETIQEYWKSENGIKFQTIAGNYKSYLLRGAERKPTFETQAIKDKILIAIDYLEQDTLVGKLKDKLSVAPIAQVEEDAL